MKKLFLVFILVSICSVIWANTNLPIKKCAPEDFVLMPWGFWSWGMYTDPTGDRSASSFYKDIADCGFNVTEFMPISEISSAKKYGLKVALEADDMVDKTNENIKERYAEWARVIKADISKEDLENIFWVYAYDEPHINIIDTVKVQCDAIRDILGLTPYVTMHPSYAVPGIYNGDYENYCSLYAKECRLDYVAYDNYSLFEGKGLDEDRFYSNMEYARNASRKQSKGFFNVILCNGHFNYAEPNDYSIHVQGWSTLAYGGKGLGYFYFGSLDLGNFRSSAYYADGTRTPVWYYVQDMNYTIHNIMPIYKGLKNENVFHFGNIPKGSNDIKSAKFIKKLVAYNKIEKEKLKPNILVGEFSDSYGERYAIIVNKDPNLSVYIDEIEFDKGKKVMRLTDKSVSLDRVRDFARGEDRWIAPGYGVFIKSE